MKSLLDRPGPRVLDLPDWLLRDARARLDRRLARDPVRGHWYRVPRPLVCSAADVVISHSPKSASTTIVDWYLAVEGRSRGVRSLSMIPHDYLEARLFWSPRFRRRLPIGRDLSSWTLLRVVRDPLTRLVASFRHAVNSGYADRELSAAAGRRIDARGGLSMREFLNHLESVDLRNCNPHHAVQRNSVDELPFGAVVTIETQSMDLNHELARFSKQMGLPSIDLEGLYSTDWQRRAHHAPPDDETVIADLDASALLRHRFSFHDARGRWPGRRLRSLPEVQEASRRLYAIDWAWLAQHRRLEASGS